MNEQKATEILTELNLINGDDGLDSNRGSESYVDWGKGQEVICLDGNFSAEDLQAIAWWMNHYS